MQVQQHNVMYVEETVLTSVGSLGTPKLHLFAVCMYTALCMLVVIGKGEMVQAVVCLVALCTAC